MPILVDKLKSLKQREMEQRRRIMKKALEFLIDHVGIAFTPEEIAKSIDGDEVEVSTALYMLSLVGVVNYEFVGDKWYAYLDENVKRRMSELFGNEDSFRK